MSKVVYLHPEEIEVLLTVASRIETFGHKGDALLLRSLVQEEAG